MSATLEVLLTLIASIVENVLPSLTGGATTSTITTIISTLEKVLPDVIQAGEDLAVTTQNIISALKGTDAITGDQWNQLDAFEKQIDAEFDSAAGDEEV